MKLGCADDLPKIEKKNAKKQFKLTFLHGQILLVHEDLVPSLMRQRMKHTWVHSYGTFQRVGCDIYKRRTYFRKPVTNNN